MDPNELITVHKLRDANKAEIIRAALRSEGIACELDGDHQAGLTGIFEIGILVRAKDADRARAFIKSHEAAAHDDDS